MHAPATPEPPNLEQALFVNGHRCTSAHLPAAGSRHLCPMTVHSDHAFYKPPHGVPLFHVIWTSAAEGFQLLHLPAGLVAVYATGWLSSITRRTLDTLFPPPDAHLQPSLWVRAELVHWPPHPASRRMVLWHEHGGIIASLEATHVGVV